MMSVALVLGMAQCKKNNDVITSGVADGTRTIALKVSENGSKISVNPSTGAVGFTKGDVIYATYKGSYVSTLTHNGTDFTGTISNNLTEGSSLVFYFVGNKTPSETPTTSMEVSIFDQSSSYPVISAGVANEAYSRSLSTYTATLNNQCALVKFNVTTSSAYAPTIIAGVNDKVTITFAAGAIGTFRSSQERGAIKIAGGSGERWAIMLPQDASGVGVAYSGDLCYNGVHGPVPEVMENGYLTDGISVTVSTALEGFSVASGRKVHFAPGNLQYLGTGTSGTLTPKWRFADNQYDYMGNGSNGNVKISGYSAYNTASGDATPTDADKQAARDLLGWGSSGGGDPATPPYLTVASSAAGYGGDSGIAGTDKDWGVYLSKSNAITNGYGKSWYTMTQAEWWYVVIAGRQNAASKRGLGKVGTVNGFVILPDSWELPAGCSFSATMDDYTTNVYSIAQWTLMEANGAVFLPGAGMGGFFENDRGLYWTSTLHSSANTRVYVLNTYAGTLNLSGYQARCGRCAVRLVH